MSRIRASLSTFWNEEQTTRLASFRMLLPFLRLIGQRAIVLDFAFRSFSANPMGLSLLSETWIGLVNIIPDDAEVMKASSNGDLGAVRELLRSGKARASDTTFEYNYTPLTNAIKSGNVELVDLLLRHGANVNGLFGMYQTSPLAWALQHRRENVIRILLERGADVNHVSALGWSPMFYLWAEIQPQKNSALPFLGILAARNTFHPFDRDLTDRQGWDILHRAAAFGAQEDVRSLISLGARLDRMVGKYQWKAVHQAVYYNNLPTFRELWTPQNRLRANININSTDERGWTFLHIAASQGHDEIVRHLLELGANPELKSKPGPWSDDPLGVEATPADAARNKGLEEYEQYIQALRDAGKSIADESRLQIIEDIIDFEDGEDEGEGSK